MTIRVDNQKTVFCDNQIEKWGKIAIEKIQVVADCAGLRQRCDSCELLALAKVSKTPILTEMKQTEIIRKYAPTSAFAYQEIR